MLVVELDKYLEAEKRLAELLGHKNIRVLELDNGRGIVTSVLMAMTGVGIGGANLPGWCRQSGAAFSLMVAHDCYVDCEENACADDPLAVQVNCGSIYIRAALIDHPSKEAAVRYAIVMAVIAKLEAK